LEILWYVQIFHGTGPSKAAARFNAAQTTVNTLGPRIEATLEQRKLEKQQKIEERKAERLEYLKQTAEVQQDGGEMGSGSNDGVKESPDMVSNGQACGDSEQKPKVDVGIGDDQETKPLKNVKPALRVLKDIRPGISCVEKVIPTAPVRHHVAQVVVDGHVFEGEGDSLSLAKASAAARALSTMFNLSCEYNARKNFTILLYSAL